MIRKDRKAEVSQLLFSLVLVSLLVFGRVSFCGDPGDRIPAGSADVTVIKGNNEAGIFLSNGYEMPVSYQGIAGLSGGTWAPLSMAEEDFEADGYPDLVCGYDAAGTGAIAVFKGDPLAFSPSGSEHLRNLAEDRVTSPFLQEALELAVPIPPEFLAAGDLSGDGWPDILVAARGCSSVYLLRGDGKGSFSDPSEIRLPGCLTAMTTGIIDEPVGRMSLVAALERAGGPVLAVFKGTDDISAESPYYIPLPAAASALELRQLDDAVPMDLAILAEGKIFVLHGNSRSTEDWEEPSRRIEPLELPKKALSMTIGRFIWNRSSIAQIAVVDEEGTLSILNPGVPDTRPFSRDEIRSCRQALSEGRPFPGQGMKAEWAPDISPAWRMVSQPAHGLKDPAGITIRGARLSAKAADDILMIDASGGSVELLCPETADGQVGANRKSISLDVAGKALVVHPMRVGVEGRSGLVVLREGEPAPAVLAPLAAAYYIVTGSGDNTNSTPTGGSGTSGNPYQMTSLRGAIIKANADGGPATITFGSATNGVPITLTIPGLEMNSYAGDLDVNVATTIIGNGPSNTIVQAGTNSTNGINRILDNNATGAVGGFPVSISGITFRYGRNTNAYDPDYYTHDGGAMYYWNGWDNAGSLTLSNCVFDQNQVLSPGSTAGGRGGALAMDAMSGNAINISNCTFSGNKTNSYIGGAIGEGSNGAVMTITNCSFSNNYAGTIAATQGGAIQHSAPTTGNMLIHNCSFSGNTSTSRGGAIACELGNGNIMTVDQNSSFTNNASLGTLNGAGEGGGIYEGTLSTGVLTVNGVTFTGNIAGSSSGDNRGGGALAFGSGDQTVKFCRIYGNVAFNGNPSAPDWGKGIHKDYNGGTTTAINNWWGCNAGPGNTGCDSAIHSHCCPPLPPVLGTINAATWLVLGITASPTSIDTGATSTLTAELNHNNLGVLVANPNYIPAGTTVAFGGTLGTASPSPVGTANGTASSTFTAGSTAGVGSGTATVDSQTVSAAITITGCEPPTLPCYIFLVEKVGTAPRFNWQDPNGAGQRTGWNIRQSNNSSLTPKTTWPLIGSNVADQDPGTAEYQWTDSSGDDPGSGGVWYYLITTYNADCPAEGPFGE